MTNGFGAGFLALTLLAVLAILALVDVLATIASVFYRQRTGQFPPILRRLFVVLCMGVLGVAGFGIGVLYDEAPAAAGVFVLLVGGPYTTASVYLAHRTELSRLDIITTTVMAWGGPFLLGVIITFGALTGIDSMFELAPAESRQLGVPWIAATTGGSAIVLGMIPIGNRLARMVGPDTAGAADG